MSNNKIEYGTSTAITITATTLAAAAARESTAIDNSSNKFFDAFVRVDSTLAAGSPASEKAIYVYAYGSEDGTNFTDNATGSDAAVTMRVPTNLKLIGTIETPDSGALNYKSGPIPVAWVFGGQLPREWGIVVRNMTNIAFTACSATYTGIYSTNA